MKRRYGMDHMKRHTSGFARIVWEGLERQATDAAAKRRRAAVARHRRKVLRMLLVGAALVFVTLTLS